MGEKSQQEERREEVDLAVLNNTVKNGFIAVNEKFDDFKEQNTREHTKLFETHDEVSGIKANISNHKIAIAGLYGLIGAGIIAAIAFWP